jgi:transcriptional coactivator HFI1/ADA1
MSRLAAGRLNQAEYGERIDPILTSETGEKEHYHNQLLAAIYGNVTREMPDQGLAPWVSANDKPTTGTGTKPVSGDAAERRLKGEVMQLPNRDRRRIKDLVQNDVRICDGKYGRRLHEGDMLTALDQFDPYESLASVFADHQRPKASRTADVPASAAGGLSRMSECPSPLMLQNPPIADVLGRLRLGD